MVQRDFCFNRWQHSLLSAASGSNCPVEEGGYFGKLQINNVFTWTPKTAYINHKITKEWEGPMTKCLCALPYLSACVELISHRPNLNVLEQAHLNQPLPRVCFGSCSQNSFGHWSVINQWPIQPKHSLVTTATTHPRGCETARHVGKKMACPDRSPLKWG